jgi:hypothetical protein
VPEVIRASLAIAVLPSPGWMGGFEGGLCRGSHVRP